MALSGLMDAREAMAWVTWYHVSLCSAWTSISQELKSVSVSVDPERMQQVIENLLSNAVKYSPPDRLAISFSIDIHGLSSPGKPATHKKVILVITDNGLGIPKAELENIFKPFYQVRHTDLDVSDGIGNGLAIVKRYAEAHGGCITVDSETGNGSMFVFSLPVIKQK